MPVQVNNLDVGVKRALAAHLRARGEAEGVADEKATAALEAAVAHVRAEAMRDPTPEDRGPAEPGSPMAWKRAFHSLRVWSAENVP